jgi:hypothetical protein
MVFQTAQSEAIRVAHDIAGQVQREENFKKLLADRMAEDKDAVNSIVKSEAMKTEERQERQRRFANQQGEEDAENAENAYDAQGERAILADGYLDFLA